MSTQPPAAPQPPEKPIQSGKTLGIVLVSIIGAFIILELFSAIHTSSPVVRRAAGNRPQTPVDTPTLDGFDKQMRDQANELKHSKEALQAAVDQARGVDLSHLMTPLPDCNQTMRSKLNGHYYVTAASDGSLVQMSCEPNDQWAVIPQAAASIEPLTRQQQHVMQTTAQSSSNGQSLAEQRKQKRDQAREEALNSSSVALDFSGKTKPVSSTQTASPGAGLAQPSPGPSSSNEGAKSVAETEKPPKYPWDQYTGPLYRVFEDTVIETVLTNRLNGEFTGPVNAMVTTDVYSRDHQHILMPQGTRILGEAIKVTANQQRRLAVVFHRAIMPDGYSVDFDKFAGLDQQGASGLGGKVNTHWAKVIGTAILVGAIGGLSEFGSFSSGTGPGVVLETGIGSQTGQQATQILDRALNVLPSVTVFEGTRIRILSAQDFTLPAYENHNVDPAL